MAGQSDPHLSIFSPSEVEFVAEDEIVEIVPNIRMEALNMICGDFGPFFPQIASKVPLWLAVALKKRGKCTIRTPDWMTVDRLTQVLDAERESPKEFQPLPFHYIEISKLLFDHARDDISDAYLVRSLIEDIRDVRFHKVETGLETISGRTHAVKLKNLSAMEVNIVRPFMVRTLQAFYKHDSPQMIQQADNTGSRPTPVTDRGPRRDLRRSCRPAAVTRYHIHEKFMRILLCFCQSIERDVSSGEAVATAPAAGQAHICIVKFPRKKTTREKGNKK
uniref:Uncharacterized protein OSJNBa0049B20.21 n=1 Tax=Oryza sativa subsp. japonica TaxID=39947 RepID=Q9XHX2_ORYSJ|nr:unknown protein [Oryza sativa Japonica Group]